MLYCIMYAVVLPFLPMLFNQYFLECNRKGKVKDRYSAARFRVVKL